MAGPEKRKRSSRGVTAVSPGDRRTRLPRWADGFCLTPWRRAERGRRSRAAARSGTQAVGRLPRGGRRNPSRVGARHAAVSGGRGRAMASARHARVGKPADQLRRIGAAFGLRRGWSDSSACCCSADAPDIWPLRRRIGHRTHLDLHPASGATEPVCPNVAKADQNRTKAMKTAAEREGISRIILSAASCRRSGRQCVAPPLFAGVSVCITHFQRRPERIQVEVSFISWTVVSAFPRGAMLCFTW